MNTHALFIFKGYQFIQFLKLKANKSPEEKKNKSYFQDKSQLDHPGLNLQRDDISSSAATRTRIKRSRHKQTHIS